MKTLRGGIGNTMVRVVQTKVHEVEQARKDMERRERMLEEIRSRRETLFELEAENEALAIRQHRAMIPAREHKYEN